MKVSVRTPVNTSLRWAIASSFTFGSVGWTIGMTIPGEVHGTSIISTIVWSCVLGALAWAPGNIIGDTIAELRTRY